MQTIFDYLIGPFNVEMREDSNAQKYRDDRDFEAERKLYPSIEHICPSGGIYMRILRTEGGPTSKKICN